MYIESLFSSQRNVNYTFITFKKVFLIKYTGKESLLRKSFLIKYNKDLIKYNKSVGIFFFSFLFF